MTQDRNWGIVEKFSHPQGYNDDFRLGTVNPNPDGCKQKCVIVRLGVIYDSWATNSKQGGLPVRVFVKTCVLSINCCGATRFK
jgi:hypothetical protein